MPIESTDAGIKTFHKTRSRVYTIVRVYQQTNQHSRGKQMNRTEIKITRKNQEITLWFDHDVDHNGNDYFDMKARDSYGNPIWNERYNRVFDNHQKFNETIKRYRRKT